MPVPSQLKYRRKAPAKAVRVAAVVIDQPVVCPGCGNPMHLSSEMQTFECKQCGREVTVDEALKALEMLETRQASAN